MMFKARKKIEDSREGYIACVDIGTGSGRAILIDLNGNQISMSQKEWLPKIDNRYPGSQDFDTGEVWILLKETIRESIAMAGINPKKIKAVTATSMREGFVLYDKKKNVIWACTLKT